MLNVSIKKIRIVLWSLLGVAIIFIGWKGVVPSGEITYTTDLNSSNDFIGKVEPETRVKENKSEIVGNPVYFSLRTPRNFRTAKVEITYKNKDVDLIEAGLLVDEKLWRYKTRPLENRKLDELSRQWHTLFRNDLIFLQKEKNFSSVEDFLKNMPPTEKVAIYNYNPDKRFVLSDYTATDSEQTLTTTLRGNHQIYTYIKKEKLDFSFSFRDINQNRDEDSVDINLYSEDRLIDSKHVPDDGITSDRGEETEIEPVDLEASGLSEGVYKIEVKANDDILIDRIRTGQKKLSFSGQVRIASNGESGQKIYTTGEEVSAKIFDPADLQSLTIGNDNQKRELDIQEAYKRYSLSLKSCDPCEAGIKNGGINLFSNGVFSFSKDSVLDPSFPRLGPGFNPEQQDIKYVLARYNPPRETESGYKRASAEFDLSRGYKEEGKYKFMISAPGLKVEDDINDFLKIKRIRIKLTGKSLWEKVDIN